jgi:hypothetical protein
LKYKIKSLPVEAPMIPTTAGGTAINNEMKLPSKAEFLATFTVLHAKTL